jgi:enoyl-CoA hydratase
VSDAEILFEKRGVAGIVTLNRPQALNSLTLPMVRAIGATLEAFDADATIASVVVRGEGERAFCAGGDIRLLHESGRRGSRDAETFWREEFRLNHVIAHYSKPYVALMDGITMGGGVGLSSHGSHRVVTERSRLAMPETGIGYFTDVGATWLLPRAPKEAGTWMGLTGLAVGAADAIHARLADHCVASADLSRLTEALAALPPTASGPDVHAAIRKMAADPGESRLAANQETIERVFSSDSMEAIIAALAKEEGEFVDETVKTIGMRAPTSLKLTLRLLRAGRRSASLAECLQRELGACLGILHNPDFYEGVRAAVIDKDRNPKWSPANLSDVGDADIDRFFVPAHPPLFDAEGKTA